MSLTHTFIYLLGVLWWLLDQVLNEKFSKAFQHECYFEHISNMKSNIVIDPTITNVDKMIGFYSFPFTWILS